MVALKAILVMVSAANLPKTVSRRSVRSGYIIAMSPGCNTTILMNARQNTYQCIADRVVLRRSPGKFTGKDLARSRSGFMVEFLVEF